tara:strand:- start:1153 stop:1626 length:474 start_codon:yes stop_codon:yes gene_type:complete
MKKWPARTAQTSKFKSKLEEEFNKFLSKNDISFGYENFTISYLKPARASRYTPDFSCPDENNNYSIIFETKGYFVTADRQKHLFIKQQYPLMDIRFIFSNSKNRIGKKSKTTYAKWCELKGFKYHCIASTGEFLPKAWIKEIKKNQKKNATPVFNDQ